MPFVLILSYHGHWKLQVTADCTLLSGTLWVITDFMAKTCSQQSQMTFSNPFTASIQTQDPTRYIRQRVLHFGCKYFWTLILNIFPIDRGCLCDASVGLESEWWRDVWGESQCQGRTLAVSCSSHAVVMSLVLITSGAGAGVTGTGHESVWTKSFPL